MILKSTSAQVAMGITALVLFAIAEISLTRDLQPEGLVFVRLGRTLFCSVIALSIGLVQLKRARATLAEDAPARPFLEWVFGCLMAMGLVTLLFVGLVLSTQ
jgi:hypothetical protein